MKISILTMCPALFAGFRTSAVIRKAETKENLELEVVDFRDYVQGSFRKIDDSPYGGGRGMIIRCEPVIHALEDIQTKNSYTVILSPAGTRFDQKKARAFSGKEHLILICGHYEGFDHRIYPYTDEAVSIGDYVLTGGELPAMVITDAVARLLKGSLREGSADEESFENGLLEYPQYTRPPVFRGQSVPEVLLSGDHRAIENWRAEKAKERTRLLRPDLYEQAADITAGGPAPPCDDDKRMQEDGGLL